MIGGGLWLALTGQDDRLTGLDADSVTEGGSIKQAILKVNMGTGTASELHRTMDLLGISATELVAIAVPLLGFVADAHACGAAFQVVERDGTIGTVAVPGLPVGQAI